jgi:hypothetical protein
MVDEIKIVCTKCEIPKRLDEFYKQAAGKHGRAQPCKVCKNAQNKKWRDDNHQRYLQIQKANRNSEEGQKKRAEWYVANRDSKKHKRNRSKRHKKWRQLHPEKWAAAYKKSISKDPEKRSARDAVKYAIRKGVLPPVQTLKCARCGKQAEHYHHYKGYAREHRLDVEPLCNVCHGAEHRTLE